MIRLRVRVYARIKTPLWLTRPLVWWPVVCLDWPWLLNWTEQTEICLQNQTSELLWWRPQAVQSRQTSPPAEEKTVIEDRKRGRTEKDDKSRCATSNVPSAARLRDKKVIRGLVYIHNWPTYELIRKSFLDLVWDGGLASGNWSLENITISWKDSKV